MTLHTTVKETIERCKDTQSKLAIFKAKPPNKFSVLFADSVQTKRDIICSRDFICTVDADTNLTELEEKLNKKVDL